MENYINNTCRVSACNAQRLKEIYVNEIHISLNTSLFHITDILK
jgi:hypothetical protein